MHFNDVINWGYISMIIGQMKQQRMIKMNTYLWICSSKDVIEFPYNKINIK